MTWRPIRSHQRLNRDTMTSLPANFMPGALGHRLPPLANTALILVIAWLAARLTWQLLPAPVPREALPPAGAAGTPRPQRAADGRELADLHLFGAAKPAEAAHPAVVRDAPITRLNLTLRGLLATDDPKNALAIIQNAKKEERHFATGDTVFGLATLEVIRADHVILLHNGRYETLRLPRELVAVAAPERRTRDVRLGKNRERVERMQALVREYHKKKLDNVRNPWQVIQWKPVMEDGRIVGMQLVAEEEREFLERHGLKLGDIVTSINGHEMDGGEGLVKALEAITEEENLVFGVRSGDRQKQVHVRVEQ